MNVRDLILELTGLELIAGQSIHLGESANEFLDREVRVESEIDDEMEIQEIRFDGGKNIVILEVSF